MTYWAINAVFLTVVAFVVVAAVAVSGPRSRRGIRGSTLRPAVLAITMAVLLAMTAVFDNIMIGVGLVGYDEARISGVFVGIAPVEDFAYAVAAVLLLPALWVLLGRSAPRRRPPSPESSGASESSRGL